MSNKRTKPAKRRSSRQKPVKQIAGHIVGLDDERSDPISRETPIKVARYRLLSNHQVPVGQRQLLATQLGKVQEILFFVQSYYGRACLSLGTYPFNADQHQLG